MGEEPSALFPGGRLFPASWKARHLVSWVAQLAEAGLVVVPMPGIPSLVPDNLHAGHGQWGVALGRTSCLETCRKGKPRCHLPSDQEAQVSFPLARTGAWEGASP